MVQFLENKGVQQPAEAKIFGLLNRTTSSKQLSRNGLDPVGEENLINRLIVLCSRNKEERMQG